MKDLATAAEVAGAALVAVFLVYLKVRNGTRNVWRDEAEAYMSKADRLSGEVNTLITEVREMRAENGELRVEVRELRVENGQLREEVRELRVENGELREHIDALIDGRV